MVEITLEEAKGKVPVLAGCGGYNTASVVDLARELAALGTDGLLVVTPYYNKPTPEGLVEHYRAIAAAGRLPVVVYNVPGRTGLNVDPATLRRLAEIDRVVGVKEASGNLGQMAAVCQALPRDFAVLSGDDAFTLPLMALGGVGVISVASNEVPYAMSRLCSLGLEGDFAAAREVHRRLYALLEVNFVETNPGPVKAALGLMGLIDPVFRLPMVYPRPASVEKVREALIGLGLLSAEGEPGEEAGAEPRLVRAS